MDSSILSVSGFQKLFHVKPPTEVTTLKLALVGYPAIGKSAFIKQFTENIFPDTHVANDRVEVTSEVIRTLDNRAFEVFLYEVPGQTLYSDLKTLFVSRIQGPIFMFAHHYAYSFNKLDYLMGFCDKYFLGECEKLVVGNSFTDRESSVYPYQAYEFCGQRGLDYLGVNIKDDPDSVNSAIGYFVNKFS